MSQETSAPTPPPKQIDAQRTSVIAFLGGLGVCIVLHLYFVSSWNSYLESLPGYTGVSQYGEPPSPHAMNAPASRRDAAIMLFIAGIVAGTLARSPKHSIVKWYLVGVAVAETGLLFTVPGFPGNLWPLVIGLCWIWTLLPAFAGSYLAGTVAKVIDMRRKQPDQPLE